MARLTGVTAPPTGISPSATYGDNYWLNLIWLALSNGGTTPTGNTTGATVKFAVISGSLSGDNVLVTAVSGKKIRVLSYVLVANAAVNGKFQSGATDISGLLYLAANGGASSGYSAVGHFETAVNTNLELNLSGAVAVGGHLTYIEVA